MSESLSTLRVYRVGRITRAVTLWSDRCVPWPARPFDAAGCGDPRALRCNSGVLARRVRSGRKAAFV
ncbi:MAG TPA: hypothetical protein VIM73_21510, partial [Polyangiaceae bacterium]